MPVSFSYYHIGFDKLMQVCSRTVNIEIDDTCKNINAIYTAKAILPLLRVWVWSYEESSAS